MKRLLLTLTVALGVIVNACAQHELSELKIYVLLLPNGDAVVEEDRTMYLADRGTDWTNVRCASATLA